MGLEALPAPPHVFTLSARALGYGRLPQAAEGGRDAHEIRSLDLAEGIFKPGPLGAVLNAPQQLAERLTELVRSLSAPVEEASLVLPDAWIRITFLEVEDLPRSREARDDVIRWKLKRLLPVRPDELRLATTDVGPLPGRTGGRRLLVALGLERLLAQLESAFSGQGIRIGRITAESLAVLTAIGDQVEEASLAAVVLVRGDGYTLLLSRAGEPVLHRFKVPDEGRTTIAEDAIERDLRLTRAFIDGQLPGAELDRVFLLAPPPAEGEWAERLEAGLGVVPQTIRPTDIALRSAVALPWPEIGPMVGAVSLEVM